MTKNKKPDTFDLFNDDSLWGNQETESLTHDDIMDEAWTKRWDNARKQKHSKTLKEFAKTDAAKKIYEQTAQRNKELVPNVVAISPEGKKHVFASLQETEEFLNCGPLFTHVLDDGMPYRGERRAKKNWIFYRDIPNKHRPKELKRLSEMVKEKTNTTLSMPWRSSKWRATPEGQKYMAELEKRRSEPNKKNKKVKTPDGIFDTNVEAAKYYGVTPASFSSRKKHNPDLYYNCDDNGKPI